VNDLPAAIELDPAGRSQAGIDRLQPLFDQHRFSHVTGFGRYVPDVTARATRRAFDLAAADDGSAVFVAGDPDQPAAATFVRPAPWETGHLGVRVGKVGDLVAEGDPATRTAAAGALLGAAGRHWADTGGGLLIARVDIDDTDVLVAAQRAGFEVLETSATYLNDNHAEFRTTHEDKGYEIRRYLRGAGADIPASSLDLIQRWVDDTDRTGHLYRDRRLDPERVAALYLDWLGNTFSGAYGDVVYTAWRDDQVVGFVSWTEDEAMDAFAGTKVLRAGIGAAVSPEGQGALGDIYAAVCSEQPLGSRLVEHTTQAGNEAVLTVWARYSTLRPSSCHYVLHGWFGG
jgi:hypothetical protein